MHNKKFKKSKLAMIGLGYVGLPLSIEFAKKREVIGFDINQKRINELINGFDSTLEITNEELKASKNISYTDNVDDIKDCNIFIVTVPTPIDSHKRPDLTLLKNASDLVGSIIKKGDVIIYESTVYPGATEEICVPILSSKSGLVFNKDFYCGYSPERVNPGDKENRINNIKKITSGSTYEISLKIDELYKEIITAGTYLAPNIKIAEAAKVIENTQRDINIALINELAIIFNKLNINTKAVLEAAETKWNFLPFKPGLVGGHCVGVDPYYLAHKSIEVGYIPEMIISGRRLNDRMGLYVSEQVIKIMIKKSVNVINSKVLIMGLTFKENCPDIRNTKVIDLISGFKDYNFQVDVYDPWAIKEEVKKEYRIQLIDNPKKNNYDVIILAVAHDIFKEFTIHQLKNFAKDNHVFYDIKGIFNSNEVDGSL